MTTKFVYLALLILGCSYCVHARAEYRVFVLKIEDSTTGQARNVTSTLDHIQYADYYPVHPTEKVSIQETWMCRNRSDRSQDIQQKYCTNPRGPASVPSTAQP